MVSSDNNRKERNACLSQRVSKLFFSHATPLFTRANNIKKKNQEKINNKQEKDEVIKFLQLEQKDLLPLPNYDHSDSISNIFENKWFKLSSSSSSCENSTDDEQLNASRKQKMLRNSIMSVMAPKIYYAGLLKALNSLLQFTLPIVTNLVLKFIETIVSVETLDETNNNNNNNDGEIDSSTFQRLTGKSKNEGFILAFLLFFVMFARALTENHYFDIVYRCSYEARVAVTSAVYKKSLRLSLSSMQGRTLGGLVNLMQVDAAKIEAFIPQMHSLWDGLFQITGYMVVLYSYIGWSCFVGLFVMLCAGPGQAFIMKKLGTLVGKIAVFTDARVETTNEAIQGVECVKMYSWEKSLMEKVNESRDKELKFLKQSAYLRGFSRAYMSTLPGIVAVCSFVVYATVSNGEIKASTLFAALVAFEFLRYPLLFYPMALALLAQARISLNRVADFLDMPETTDGMKGTYSYLQNDTDNDDDDEKDGNPKIEKGEIYMKDAVSYWSDPENPTFNSRSSMSSNSSVISTSSSQQEDGNTASELGSSLHLRPAVSNSSMNVKPGELCAVVGRVASGKTALCSTLLNENVLIEGEIKIRGSIAYATQSAWILNKTIMENILFGSPMDRERYDAVIQACQLTHDLSILSDGDQTEIGERGINLSGGQKQRISVARAAYSKADIIILDDPLSALDPAVGQKLFDECILGLMKDKTRIFVTNHINHLEYCDKVVSISDGSILEQGTFEELMNSPDGEVYRLINELNLTMRESHHGSALSKSIRTSRKSKSSSSKNKKDEKSSSTESMNSTAINNNNKKGSTGGGGDLMTQEERAIGAVKWSVYKRYLKSGGGLCTFSFVFFFFFISGAVELAKNACVSAWTSDPNYERFSMNFYMSIYAAAAVLLGVVTFLRSFLLTRLGVSASRTLHKDLLSSIIRAPMSFFDTTPTGRIISRFSKDIYSIDLELTEFFDFFLFCAVYLTFTMAIILYATPWFGIACIPLVMLYLAILNYFREVSRETKRLDSLTRSPVYSSFSESLGGLETIRAYNQTSRFLTDFLEKVDKNTQAFYCLKVAERWLSVRTECLAASFAGTAALIAVTTAVLSLSKGAGSINSAFASIVGLSLSYAINISGFLNFCIRSFSSLENAMNSVERVAYYTDDIAQEAPFHYKSLPEFTKKYPDHPASLALASSSSDGSDVSSTTTTLSKDWPTSGTIHLHNLMMRYRSETPLVLKSLNVQINGGERVGVVGRTGSGKSSLLLCLMRLVEPDLRELNKSTYNAPITIDGVDILRIGLTDLRSQLGIIPQNPVLFAGTIRSNMDPYQEHSDDEVWSALASCGMEQTVLETMDGGLDAVVTEYGKNLSQGQRQLLCMGRTLLKKCKIMLLDEATSSLDFESDREIQHTLRTAFPQTTVLTIAHRVDTIMDSDKILVMDDGRAAEFASPESLLKDENSLFSQIVNASQQQEEEEEEE